MIVVKLHDGVDAQSVASDFREKCRGCAQTSDDAIEGVAAIVADLDRRGREISALGSHMAVDRTVDCGDVTVKISARYGAGAGRQPLVRTLWSMFVRRQI